MMVPIVPDQNSVQNSESVVSDSYEDYQEIQMLSDPGLNGDYQIVENDNHNAFEGNSQTSQVELLWSHRDGMELDFRESSDMTNNLPNCEEYVYVSESFVWDYNVLPTQVTAHIDYDLNLIGDFDSISWPYLHHVYIWIIDSSGEWTRIYTSTSIASESVVSTISVSYDAISRAWGGTVTGDSGTQEDPSDTLTFAIGIAPTYAFAYDHSAYWNWMNGVIQILVDSMSLTCIVNPNPDEETYLEPDFVRTRGTTYDDVTQDIAITEDGAIYTISTTYSDNSSITLTKYTTTGDELWTRSLQGSTPWMGFGIAITDSEIVAVGSAIVTNESDTLIAKWNHQGVLQWNKTVNLGGNDYGLHADIADDGSIFVIGSYLGEIVTTAYLAKFTIDGSLSWSKNGGLPFGDIPWDIAVASDGYVYTATRLVIAKWDMDGTQVWHETGVYRSVKITRDGNLYTTNLLTPTNLLQQWYSNGTKGWSIALTYNHTYRGETYLYPELLGVTPAGWAYIRLTSAFGIGKFILAIVDTEGLQLWNQTIDPEYMGHPYYHYLGGAVEVHSSGFVCFAPSILSLRGDIDTCLQLYLTNREPPIISSPLTIVLIVVAVVLMVAIPLDYIRRKRSFGEEEELPEWMTTQVYLRS